MDDARRRILARRAAFVAVAAAGMAGGSCEPKPTEPRTCLNIQAQPCLSQPMPRDTSPEDTDDGSIDAAAVPQPCLEVALPSDAGPTGTGGSAPDAKPTVCLKIQAGPIPPTQPKPDAGPKSCLNVY